MKKVYGATAPKSTGIGPQICIPSIHKATSPTRYLRKKDFQKKHIAADDMPHETYHLHTTGRVGNAPLSVGQVKHWLLWFYCHMGYWPDTIETTTWANNRYISVSLGKYGCRGVRFKKGDLFKVYAKGINRYYTQEEGFVRTTKSGNKAEVEEDYAKFERIMAEVNSDQV